MESRKVSFRNEDGVELAARLDLPAMGRPEAFALFAHCFTCSKNFKAVRNVSEALTGRGIAVLRFDFTGLGESQGEFEHTTFVTNVQDLVSAARFLEKEYEAPQLLIGHSLGGTAVLQAAAGMPSARAVVVIASPSDPSHLKRLLGATQKTIEEQGAAEITLGGRTFPIRRKFLEDLEQPNMADSIRNLQRALLVLHSPLDEIVGIENASQIFQAARHPKSFVSLDRADHLLSDVADSSYAGAVIAAWACRYLQFRGGDVEDGVHSEGEVVVRTEDGYRTEIRARGHRFVADEPRSAGGSDAGPTPYDYLIAALGACSSITMRMYADRKGWPLEEVTVRLRHEKIHAVDCENCQTQQGKIDWIDREIELVGTLGRDQRERLVKIANQCPVHRTLHSETVVNSTLKD